MGAVALGSALALPASVADPAWTRLVEAGVEAERLHDPEAALDFYRQALALRPDDAFVLQKIAQQISDATFRPGAARPERARVREALDYAQRAAELDPTSAVNRLSVAILHGRLAAYGGARDKVEHARRVREHAEAALALDPQYAWAHHVLGRWHVEMAELGATARAFAAVLFGGLPPASREEGIRFLEHAVALEPEAVAHRVELAFAYARAGRTDEARAAWTRSLELEPRAIYDLPAQQRAREALEGGERRGRGR